MASEEGQGERDVDSLAAPEYIAAIPAYISMTMRPISQAILVLAVIATVAGGSVLLVRSTTSGGRIEIALPAATASPVVELRVYITGAVRNPGLYSVNEGDRLAQVIEAAGGATEDANLTAVNLALRVADEQHWHIPKVGETVEGGPPIQATGGGAVATESVDSRIDINAAGAQLLQSLPGIGEVKAKAIVGYREANGPFATIEDLLQVRGIGSATLDAIRDLVVAH